MAATAEFLLFSSYLPPFCYGCVIATDYKLPEQINYYNRLLENIAFGACVCMRVHLLGGLNLVLALCSKYYFI